MKSKFLAFSTSLSLLLLIFGCNNSVKIGEENIDQELVIAKSVIDEGISTEQYYTEVLAKQIGKDGLVHVKYDNWPTNVELVYNIWRSPENKIKLIAESPLHANQGLNVVFETYFNDEGQTFAHVKTFEYFNSVCSMDPIYERHINYYDENHNVIGKAFRILDEQNNILDYENCKSVDPPELEYTIYRDLESFLNYINSILRDEE